MALMNLDILDDILTLAADADISADERLEAIREAIYTYRMGWADGYRAAKDE